MNSQVFGRTNQVFPATWLSLQIPLDADEIQPLAEAAGQSGLPIDVSVAPALWGGKLRGTEAVLSCFSSTAYETATESAHAVDLTQAHLIEVLSCLGREHLDFYFVRVRQMVEEFQISGVLEALEWAKQEGHIRFMGLACEGPPLSSLATWQFHDAFEAVYLPNSEAESMLGTLARQRRVGILRSPSAAPAIPTMGEAVLVPVRSASAVFEVLT